MQKPDTAPSTTAQGVEEIVGIVDNIVFRSEDTGYTVCAVSLPKRKEPVMVVGNCTVIWAGETLKASGRWTYHRQHGHQFAADTITCAPPTSGRGIERYLASGMIRGIGKVYAERLVTKFGDQTLHIIEHDSGRLQEVEGIGRMRRQQIKESWNEQRGIRDIMIFLQGHGIGTAQSARIFKHYGNKAIELIRENPYRLCHEVWGIGFKTADKVAMSVGIPKESEIRARAGLVYTLNTMAEEGHCFCLQPELLLRAQELLDIPVETLAKGLEYELSRNRIVRDEDRIYLSHLYQAEVDATHKLGRLLATPATFKSIAVDKAVPWAASAMKIEFAPMQIEALSTALSSKVSIITGGPGVGKTTIIRALVDVYHLRKLQVVLAAPTGRAAKRMSEATGREARTLHRLLKYVPRNGQFEHNNMNPLEGDVFILDEVSMIDIVLMNHFVDALPDRACLILVGDIDQLPSVGPGNVLRDLINSGVIPSRRLDHIFRQEKGGLIIRNAHHVNNGEALELPAASDVSDFYFISAEEPADVIQKMLYLVTERIPKRFGFDPMTQIQVLTPMRRNQLGAENLNQVLQEALNPRGECLESFGRKYRVGDRIMQLRNNYDKEVYNGDVGWITKLDGDDRTLVVSIDGRDVVYDFNELDEMVHAYACSIHKSQGSEYPAVVILMTTQHFKLLQRNLLYTAITRGKKLVCLVGSHKAIGMATRNNEIRMRRTWLSNRLAGTRHTPEFE